MISWFLLSMLENLVICGLQISVRSMAMSPVLLVAPNFACRRGKKRSEWGNRNNGEVPFAWPALRALCSLINQKVLYSWNADISSAFERGGGWIIPFDRRPSHIHHHLDMHITHYSNCVTATVHNNHMIHECIFKASLAGKHGYQKYIFYQNNVIIHSIKIIIRLVFSYSVSVSSVPSFVFRLLIKKNKTNMHHILCLYMSI